MKLNQLIPSRDDTSLRYFVLLLLLFFAGIPSPLAASFTIDECQECHGDDSFWEEDELRFLISTEKFQSSIHGSLLCTDCHVGLEEAGHDEVPPAQCVDCHESTIGRKFEMDPEMAARHQASGEEYATSIHAASLHLGGNDAARCDDCHGNHYMVPLDNHSSPVYKFNLPATCAKCHSNADLSENYKMNGGDVPSHFAESIHGSALLEKGLIVAPSCSDCHGVHNIRRGVDEGSPISHTNIGHTCGACHVGVEDIYNQSIHGQALAEGNESAPICTDCHTAHDIATKEQMGFKKALSDERCGSCHEDRLHNYQETYHGKAMELGRPNDAPEVAACYDCHGHHDVLPSSDPNSHLSPDNILGTCQKCHPKANAGFTQYQPHANPLDSVNYPLLNKVFLFMTVLLLSVFAFFGAHTLLWLLRTFWLFRHDSKAFREAKAAQSDTCDEWFSRFTPFERFLHVLVVTSFLLLVLTGMPLKFYYTDWAKIIFNLMGGPAVARSLHHFGAIITFVYFGLHLFAIAIKSWSNRGNLRDPQSGKFKIGRLWDVLFGPDSMVPTLQDWREFVAHQRWFFGKGEKPQFDRWTYWEKFDYLAVFWGVFIIGSSGMILWFPEFFSQFLPGWFINIAIIVHSDEALLAAGFIFTIHFFNTHFRLEKFPMDTVIFTGRISKAEMLHERKRWYDRLLATGHLDRFRRRDDWERSKQIAKILGFVFLGVGVALLALIIFAMTTRLVH